MDKSEELLLEAPKDNFVNYLGEPPVEAPQDKFVNYLGEPPVEAPRDNFMNYLGEPPVEAPQDNFVNYVGEPPVEAPLNIIHPQECSIGDLINLDGNDNTSRYIEPIPVYDVGRADQKGWTMLLSLKIAGLAVSAVVDTGSQATIISQSVFDKLNLIEADFPALALRGITQSTNLPAKMVQDVELQVGSQVLRWDFAVAAIRDECILGLDFLGRKLWPIWTIPSFSVAVLKITFATSKQSCSGSDSTI